MNATPLLSGRGLTKDYPMGAERVHALRGVDVDVYPGDFLALRGPSGSGKTTLINLLGLLDVPDQGSLLLEGRDTATLSENERADTRRDRFGFVFQSFNLIPVLTAAELARNPWRSRTARCAVGSRERPRTDSRDSCRTIFPPGRSSPPGRWGRSPGR